MAGGGFFVDFDPRRLNRMRRTSTSWKDVKGNLQHAGKLLKKELGTVGRVVGRVAEPGFSRRERRRVLHLKRIEEHELRSLAITRQRLQIERDREALRYRKAGIERSRGRRDRWLDETSAQLLAERVQLSTAFHNVHDSLSHEYMDEYMITAARYPSHKMRIFCLAQLPPSTLPPSTE